MKGKAGFPNGSRRDAENSFAPGVGLFLYLIYGSVFPKGKAGLFIFGQIKGSSRFIVGWQISAILLLCLATSHCRNL